MMNDIVAQDILWVEWGHKQGVTSNAVTQSESDVPWWPCPTQPQIP